MAIELVVVTPFGEHQKGAVISDATLIAAILASEQEAHVVKVTAPVAQVEEAHQ
ncbi:MAG: hypothetical protein P4L71_20070 [Acetobacteraceae bacterium]|nr:hypothetical protein [Acetobacteraceae bacterium]